MIKKVTEENKPLEIGKFYLVPCVLMPEDIAGFQAGKFIPVIGELHTDPELDAHFPHYHYDNRFIQNPVSLSVAVSLKNNETGKFIFPDRIFWKKRKCYRNQMFYPSVFCARLEPKYNNCRLIDGYCPHRKMYLKGYMADAEGNVICPLSWLEMEFKHG